MSTFHVTPLRASPAGIRGERLFTTAARLTDSSKEIVGAAGVTVTVAGAFTVTGTVVRFVESYLLTTSISTVFTVSPVTLGATYVALLPVTLSNVPFAVPAPPLIANVTSVSGAFTIEALRSSGNSEPIAASSGLTDSSVRLVTATRSAFETAPSTLTVTNASIGRLPRTDDPLSTVSRFAGFAETANNAEPCVRGTSSPFAFRASKDRSFVSPTSTDWFGTTATV